MFHLQLPPWGTSDIFVRPESGFPASGKPMLISFHGAYAGEENNDMHIWRTINRLRTMISAMPEDPAQTRSRHITAFQLLCAQKVEPSSAYSLFNSLKKS